ncbi:TRAP transporter permease [Chloroflexota bacterium]
MPEKERDKERFLSSKYRKPAGIWRALSLILPAAGLTAAIIYVFQIIILGRVMLDLAYSYLLLALFLPLIFIWTPIKRGVDKDKMPRYDILLVIISFCVPIYFFFKAADINYGWSVVAPLQGTILAAVLWLVVIEASRRAVSNLFAVLVLLFSTYPFYAFIMPGLLLSNKFALTRVINFHAFSEDSILGIPMHVFGLIVFGFMTFAIVIQIAGAGKLFNDLALALLGKTRGGTAKVAIVASGLFGSVSGSPVANVLTTGAFTIPAMKKAGFPAHFAAAIEATASTGGALMPPIMSAAAFVMAEYLEVPYAEVAIAAFIPSVLYYLTVFMQIDAYSARVGLKPEPITTVVPKIWRILLDNLHIILGAATLIYVLFVLYMVQWSPWIGSAVIFVLAMLRKRTRLYLRDLINFIEDVGRNMGDLVGIMASVGMVIGSFIITGVAHALPYSTVSLAQGNVYLLLFLGAVAAFILGMGVPIIATYIFLAIVLAPGLVVAGLDPMAAHLFLMYCAVMSMITPPVALSAFTAAVIADANAMRTGFKAMRLGLALFIVPFFFVLNPALVLRGSLLDTLQMFPTAALGLALIGGALEGYIWRIGAINIPVRVLFFAAGFLLAIPNTTTDIAGVVLVVLLVSGYLIMGGKRNQTVTVS